MNSNNHITVDQIKNDAEVIKKNWWSVGIICMLIPSFHLKKKEPLITL